MNSTILAELSEPFEYRLDLYKAATPRLLKSHPIHNWFFFPHSYSPELVEAILDDLSMPKGSKLLDPCIGAGTTLLVAQQRGLNATGYDLSPVSILVSNVKIRDYNANIIRESLNSVIAKVKQSTASSAWESERLKKALSEKEQVEFWNIRQAIMEEESSVRDFFLVALLRISRDFSRALSDGGWLRWIEKPDQSDKVFSDFKNRVERMIEELDTKGESLNGLNIEAINGDARDLNVEENEYDGFITSPPYPNRHDYSRIFHIELLLLGQDEADIKDFRYNSIRSHVEAHAPIDLSNDISTYEEPAKLTQILNSIPDGFDERIPHLLRGYFEDLFSIAQVAYRTLKPNMSAAFVVGNVRYGGVLVLVDEILADIGGQAGFTHEKTWVIRLRGNSAQQMGSYGRESSRESIVFLRKPQ